MKDKVVLVTGSTSGIGKETAIHFASLGAKVVITGRRSHAITEAAEDCERASPYGYKPLEVVADLTVDDDIRRLVEATISHFGQLDVLVNNMGYGGFSPIDDPNFMETYQKMTDADVRVPLFLIHLCVPHLEKTKGCIVNVSAVASMKAIEKWTVYCMAKAAMDMMTSCLAMELGPKGIRINNVNPAYVKTNFQTTMGLDDDMNKGFRDACAAVYPLRRVGEPIDIAKAIAFLASEDASWITGEMMCIDGGARFANMPH